MRDIAAAFFVITALAACDQGAPDQAAKQLSFEEKARATIDARNKEYAADRERIKIEIATALNAGKIAEAKGLLARYGQSAGGELDELAKKVDIADTNAVLVKASKDNLPIRRSLVSRMITLEPKNPKWPAQLAEIDRAMTAQATKIAKSIKDKKRREGVNIGMSQQDVLDSSWGRPERVNKTTTAAGTREQWVYRGYHSYLYFENGVLTTIQN